MRHLFRRNYMLMVLMVVVFAVGIPSVYGSDSDAGIGDQSQEAAMSYNDDTPLNPAHPMNPIVQPGTDQHVVPDPLPPPPKTCGNNVGTDGHNPGPCCRRCR